MKPNLASSLAIAGTVLLLQSCAVSSVAQSETEPDIKPNNTVSGNSYVIHKDGTKQNFQSLKLVTGVFTSPHLLADGKLKIAPSNICAYQNEDHFALAKENLVHGRRSKSAVEALPGFAVRIVSGKLNVYCQKYYNGSGTSEKLFIQLGEDGAVMAYTPELLNAVLKDHPEAFNLFNSSKKVGHFSKKLLATAELFNRQPLLTKN